MAVINIFWGLVAARREGRGWGLLLAVERSRLQPGAEAGGAARAVALQANSSSGWRHMENSPEIPRLGLVWGMTHPLHSPLCTLLSSQQPARGSSHCANHSPPRMAGAAPGAAGWRWESLGKTPRGRSNPATHQGSRGLCTVHFSPFAFHPTWLQSKPRGGARGRLG